jgi:hypothetical protein
MYLRRKGQVGIDNAEHQQSASADPEGVWWNDPEYGRDSLHKKAVILGLGALVVTAALGGGYALLRPADRPPVFAEIPFLDGTEVNCAEVVERYEPDDAGDLQIAHGAPAIFRGPGYQHGLQFYYDHIDAVVVSECDMYLKRHPDTKKRMLVMVDTDLEPSAGEPGSFKLVATVTETGKLATIN